jgi:hypothetical protein
MSKLISTDPAMRYYVAPYIGEPTSENSTRQLLWADCFAGNSFNEVHSPSAVALAGPNGWLQMYAFRKTSNQFIMTFREQDKVAKTKQPLLYYYNVNPITGIPPAQTPDNTTTPDFVGQTRPYYVNATKANGKNVWTVHTSNGVGGIVANHAKQTNITSGGTTFTYVPFAQYNFQYFDDLLASYSGSYLVAYIMDTDWGYLYATSRNFDLNLTQFALSSPDSYISASARYIRDNGITTNTDRWVPELGYSIQVRFYNSPDPGLRFTLVSAASDGAIVTSSNDETDDKIDIIYDISIAVLVFVFLSFLIACYSIYSIRNNPKTTSLASRDAKAVQM